MRFNFPSQRRRRAHTIVTRLACILLFSAAAGAARADDLDDLINTQMREHRIPGLSLAVVSHGAIVREQGYGTTTINGQAAVTPATLFQAASISKFVAAAAALRLVESGKMSLDADINRTLRSWHIPDNEFTKDSKVTLRGILSNSAGLTVASFPGYDAGAPLPTLLQVLEGAAPANTAPIRVDRVPRSQWRYSGGGHVVLQQAMADATGVPFTRLMDELVLQPFEMKSSSFAQPLPPAQSALAASGHMGGQPMPGHGHVYPEQAAAGLWSTASDLARFAIGLQRAFQGSANPVISQAMAREMMSRQIRSEGLGVFVMGTDRAPSLWYGGRNKGFDAFLWFSAKTGDGIVIMINANDDAETVTKLAKAIAAQYQMATFPFP